MRILKGRLDFKDLVSKVFTFDYIGALFASLLFPLVLVPHLGLIRSASCSACSTRWWRSGCSTPSSADNPGRGAHNGAALPGAGRACRRLRLRRNGSSRLAEASIYPDHGHLRRIHALSAHRRSPAPRRTSGSSSTATCNSPSRDEYRYHEALVHPGAEPLRRPARRAGARRRRRPGGCAKS